MRPMMSAVVLRTCTRYVIRILSSWQLHCCQRLALSRQDCAMHGVILPGVNVHVSTRLRGHWLCAAVPMLPREHAMLLCAAFGFGADDKHKARMDNTSCMRLLTRKEAGCPPRHLTAHMQQTECGLAHELMVLTVVHNYFCVCLRLVLSMFYKCGSGCCCCNGQLHAVFGCCRQHCSCCCFPAVLLLPEQLSQPLDWLAYCLRLVQHHEQAAR